MRASDSTTSASQDPLSVIVIKIVWQTFLLPSSSFSLSTLHPPPWEESFFTWSGGGFPFSEGPTILSQSTDAAQSALLRRKLNDQSAGIEVRARAKNIGGTKTEGSDGQTPL